MSFLGLNVCALAIRAGSPWYILVSSPGIPGLIIVTRAISHKVPFCTYMASSHWYLFVQASQQASWPGSLGISPGTAHWPSLPPSQRASWSGSRGSSLGTA